MSRQLGETSDPAQLIPGNPSSVTATAQSLRLRGDALHKAGSGLQRIDTSDGWTGAAADAFRSKFQGKPGNWLEAGDCFHATADVLTSYAGTLTWAQKEAATAIAQWNAGQADTREAVAAHQQAEQQAGHALPFTDPGEVGRRTAQNTLEQARRQLDSAGDKAATAAGQARDKAPEKPGFWSKVGDFFEDVGAGLANTGGHLLNGLASLGNAMTHHPGEFWTAAAGAGLMVAGAAGDAAGGLLDLTVVGGVIGVPVNVVSTGAIVVGGGLVVGAGGELMMHAASDDSVNPARTDYTGSGGDGYEPTEGFRGSEFSKDEIVQFINGHTDNANPAMGRPSQEQIDAALTKGDGQKVSGRNAETFEYKGVHVVVNYDMPWRSSSWFVSGR
jgi:uncharacterized protein YukE